MKYFTFTSECAKLRLVAVPDPLGEIAVASPLNWIKSRGREKGRGRKGERPPISEVR